MNGSDRLSSAFAKPRAALVCFLTAGDGDTSANLDALVEGGADVIELGMPFTDPMADGPAIQAANIRSLAAGTKTVDIWRIARGFRERHPDVPLVLMGYANTILRKGGDFFVRACEEYGVDGVICVDVPPEEDQEFGPVARGGGVATIRLATPTTDDKRLETVLDGACGFLYYVSVAGITGKQQAAINDIADNVARIRKKTDLPIAVGFGVRTPEQAEQIAKVADGVVVGSALVELVGEHGVEAPQYLRELTSSLAKAVHSAAKARA